MVYFLLEKVEYHYISEALPDSITNLFFSFPYILGAGYAGGIISAAHDGIKVAEAISKDTTF